MNIYTVYHLHDDTSNCNGYADSCSNFKEYIKLAKKQGMKAIAFSNHGGIYDWIKKKQECDKAGLKYIHGIELYLCNKLQDDDRGGHIGLYAKNWDGVLELNNLISVSTSKGVNSDNSDRHMYYNPRISLDEIMNTSDSIIITSACLASPLNKWDTPEKHQEYELLLNWMIQNKHRCFLEVQYHNNIHQIAFNKKLYQISLDTGIRLIAGTDTHSSSKYKAECRKILQKSKDSFYGEEDEFDLTWKTYDELIQCFKEQNSLPEEVYLQAIENTNVLANMVEDFKLDKTFKYPTLYGDNVRQQWQKLILSKFSEKKKLGIIDCSRIEDYKKHISEEFSVMCKLGMESFMMFMSELLSWCTENNIPYGTGRGSVCGSVIAYLTDITDVDPIKWNTVFSRFCNADRISLGDIDVDFAPEDRIKVYEYIIKRFTPEKTAYIAAFSTLKDRGCIDVLAKGLNYKDLDKVMSIKNQFEELYKSYGKIMQEEVNIEELVENGEVESSGIDFEYHNVYLSHINNESAKHKADSLKNTYNNLIAENSDLFYYLDGLKGTIIAKGSHPSGIIGSPITLADNIGLFYKDGDINMPVSTCAMKSVDSLNYVKFDILGLKTVGIIKDACRYLNIPYPKSHLVNWDDEKVWDNMILSQQGVFQFEGDYAHRLLKDFKPHTINHMSMVNAALRPSGKSYRDRLIAGEFNNNPSEEIDNLLKDNNGYLIFQEDTIKFLTDICDFTGSAADTTRRAIGKKDKELLKQQLPKILEGYCKHSSKPKEIAEEEAKQFIKIVEDSSEYQFGYNHSTAYSMNGYECVMLRTYYPLEFITAYLNRAENNDDINNGVDLAKQFDIHVKPIKFRYSKAEYAIDRDTNTIYKGISSIKYCSEQIAEELYLLKDNIYNFFSELLIDISSKTTVNSKQLRILTLLNFFSEFGKTKKLLTIIDMFDNVYGRKQIKFADIEKLNIPINLIEEFSKSKTEKMYKNIDTIGILKKYESSVENKGISLKERLQYEFEYLGYIEYINNEVSNNLFYVLELKTYADKTKPYLQLYRINNGETISAKITKGQIFIDNPFNSKAVLLIKKLSLRPKSKLVNGKWEKSLTEFDNIIEDYDVY
jgi:DNA polymerase-3 subunit alpha